MRKHRFMTGLTVSLVAVLWLSMTATAEARGKKPSLQRNTGISIVRGSPPVFLTTAHLYSTDQDDGDSTIFYKIKSITNMGGCTLTVNGVPAVVNTQFPQSALVAGNVVAVQHNGIVQTSASFKFSVLDDDGNYASNASNLFPATFSITITEPVNVPPTLTWVEPDGNGDTVNPGDPFTLKWTDADPDDNALIDLYYADGVTSTYIGSAFEDPDGAADELVWNTTGVAEGSYYLCARVTDKGGTRFFDVWSTYPVTIGSGSGGSGWQPMQPANLTNESTFTAKALEMDGLGNAMFVQRTATNEWKYNIFNGTAWGTEAIAPGMLPHTMLCPTLESDGAGNYLLVYKNNISPCHVFAKFYRGSTGWETATTNVSPTQPISINGSQYSSANDAALSANGDAMAVWVRYASAPNSTVWASHYDGTSWGPEVSLGTGMLVSVAADTSGNFMAVFAEADGQPNEGDIYCALYTNGGGWGTKTLLHSRTTDGLTGAYGYSASSMKKSIDVVGTGNLLFASAYITHSAGSDILSGPGNRLYGRVFKGTDWEVERRLDNGSDRDIFYGATQNGLGLAIAPNGTALTVYGQLNADATPICEVWANRYDGADWSTLTPTRISFPADATYGDATTSLPFGGPLVMDAGANGTASFIQYVNGTRETINARYEPATGWGAPSLISAANNGESEAHHQLAGEASGKAIVVWQQETSGTWWSRAYVK